MQSSQNLEEEIVGEAEYEVEVYPKPFVSYDFHPVADLKKLLILMGKDTLVNRLEKLNSAIDLLTDRQSIEKTVKDRIKEKDLIPLFIISLLYEKGIYEDAASEAFELLNGDIDEQFKPIIRRIFALSSLNAGRFGDVSAMFIHDVQTENADSIITWAVAEDIYYQKEYERSERISSRLYNSTDRELSALALYNGGWSNLHMKKYNEALGLLERALQRTGRPELINILKIGKAIALFNSGKRQEAYSLIKSIDENSIPEKSRKELLYYRGLIAYYNKDDDLALKDMSRFVQEFPEDPRSAFIALKLSDLYRFRGDFKEAISNLEWIVANFGRIPEKENALYLLGELYYSQEDYEKALHRYLQLMDEFGESDYIPAARIRVEQILTKLATDDEKYIDMFERYFPNSPKLADVYYYWGGKYFQKGDLEKAAEYFYKLAIKFPNHPKAPEALYTAGQLYLKMGKYADAAEAFKRLINLYPKFDKKGDAYAGIGVSLINEGRPAEAVRFLENALHKEASNLSEYDKAIIYMYLGMAYEKSGNLIKARDYLERARNQFFAIGRVDKLEEVNKYLDALPQ